MVFVVFVVVAVHHGVRWIYSDYLSQVATFVAVVVVVPGSP